MTSPRRILRGSHVYVVDSFEALLAAPFDGTCSAICWERTLAGDFGEVARLLGAGDGVTALDAVDLESLPVSNAGAVAVAVLLADLRRLREAGHAPELSCVGQYPEDADRLVPTDVYSFHVDSATVPTDTFLCSYTSPTSEGLRHDEARPRADVPELRARLLARYGGADDAGFTAFLREQFHELHYLPVPRAQPWDFGIGNLWRIAVQVPGARVPACIHRAPRELVERGPRLLLIS
jgi:hypothetical protein